MVEVRRSAESPDAAEHLGDGQAVDVPRGRAPAGSVSPTRLPRRFGVAASVGALDARGRRDRPARVGVAVRRGRLDAGRSLRPGAMAEADDPAHPARLAELRRRLYRRDATEEDLDRYVALRDALTPAAPPHAVASRPPATRRRLSAGGVLLGAAAVCVAAVLLHPVTSEFDAAARAGAAIAPDLPADGTPQVGLRFTDDSAPPPRSSTVEVTVEGAAVLGQRFTGTGDALVQLVVGGAPLDGGRLTVTLRSSDRTPVTWQAAGGSGRRLPAVVVAPNRLTVSLVPVGPTSVDYRGAPPTSIRVQAPAETGWRLTAAFTRSR